MKKMGFILPFIFILQACSQVTTERVPLKNADTDGFEVIVNENLSINSLKLQEAEKIIKNSSSATYLLPEDKVDFIENQIKKHNEPDSNYPFIKVEVKKVELQKEMIDLSFHYSTKTYHYYYEASDKQVKPLWSSFHDMGKNKKTIYE